MKGTTSLIKMTFSLLIVVLGSGCSLLLHQPVAPTKARLGEETQSTIDLKNLPEAKSPIIVAVYKFRDQTGQYKPSENGTSWSTAVTQGATTVLIKALEDSKWFIPIERENVSNLLNERKIIRSSRAQYNSEGEATNQNDLPPLLYAGVILEGGIISYDANVITGGAGLRYFGAGASGQYRQDRVTVYLRAVSTSNGKVLKTVYTSKTILSQAMDAGLFRFVRFGRLLEAETGFTYNEPSELALTEAIEKAVMSLIIEGVKEKLWDLKEERNVVSDAFLQYDREKKRIPQTDIFNKVLDNRRKQIGLNISTTSLQYRGDYPNPAVATGVEAGLLFSPGPKIGLALNYGISSLATKDFFRKDVTYADLNLAYRFSPYNLLTPYAYGGFGVITENETGRFDFSNRKYPKINVGAGIEFLINNSIGLKTSMDYNVLLSDTFDAVEQGRYNDHYWRANIGFNFYFGREIRAERKFKYSKKK